MIWVDRILYRSSKYDRTALFMPKPLKILQASAGSGKTFSLAAHYLTILFSGPNKYRDILAVTFTNKATEEMKSRILDVLRGFAVGDPSSKIEDYRVLVLAANTHLNATELQLEADKIYRAILHDYSRFSVSTIDGFVQKVIRGFAFELGLDSGYSLEMNSEKVKHELVAELDKVIDEKENIRHWIIDLALDRIANNKGWNYRDELSNLVREIFKDNFKNFELAINEFGAENADAVFKEYIDFSKRYITEFESEIKGIAAQGLKLIIESGLTADQFKGKTRSQLLRFRTVAEGAFGDVEKLLKLIDDEENWMAKGVPNTLFGSLNPLLHQITAAYQKGHQTYVLAKEFMRNGYFLRLMQEIAGLLSEYRKNGEKLLISDAQKLLN
ncbi:MAG: DNA helicase UvrD, partial [Sphingobacteriales bacterium]